MVGLFGIVDLSAAHQVDFGRLFFEDEFSDDLLNDRQICNRTYIERHVGKKFYADKVFQNNEDVLVAVDGVILNSKMMIKKYNAYTLYDAIVLSYRVNEQSFIKEFDGNFCGVLSDNKNDVCYIFNNIMGSKNMFYHISDDRLLFSSDINYIIKYMKENSLSYSFNERAAKSMLTIEYLYDDATYFNEISRLPHGYCIAISNNKPQVIQYYDYIRKPLEGRSEVEILSDFDRLFRQAVTNAFEKDREYSYEHIACLSAGLDCKMVTWLAHELGYGDNITNITYSQPDFWDESVPKQMTQDLEHKYIYISLANGLNSLSIDERVRLNGGSYYYLGIAHGKAAFAQIDMDKFGLIHTGLFSDIARGNFYKESARFDLSFLYNGRPFSDTMFSDKELEMMKKRYKTNMNYLLYIIGCNSENTQFVGLSHITEPYSPFFSKELLEFCMEIPIDYRKDSTMYKRWIIDMYPKAASYIWDKTNAPLNDKMIKIPWNNNIIPMSRLKKYLTTKIRRKIFPFVEQRFVAGNSKTGNMNPMDYWYATSETFKKTYDEYFHDNIGRLSFSKELYAAAEEIYTNTSGNYTGTSKARVLTVLSVLKNYF